MPTAMLQMEKLGSCFHVSGPYADRVKDLLQRANNVRLDRLALVVGWRKNDSASLMAQSAGGQAISLVALCLRSLYGDEELARILAGLCTNLLPYSSNVASQNQLLDVANILANKVGALGFGNLLAQEVSKLHDAFRLLVGVKISGSWLEPLSADFMIDLLGIIGDAFRQDGSICRIRGEEGMGQVISLLKALFPVICVSAWWTSLSMRPKISRFIAKSFAQHEMSLRKPFSRPDCLPKHQSCILFIAANFWRGRRGGLLISFSSGPGVSVTCCS